MKVSKTMLATLALVAIGGAFILFNRQGPSQTAMPAKTATTPLPAAPMAAKIEAPNAAPALAGGGLGNAGSAPSVPSMPTASQGMGRGTLIPLGPNNTNPNPKLPPSTWADVMEQQRDSLEKLKATFAQAIARAQSNGDPEVLARAQQQYDSYAQQEQEVDSLATDPAARRAYLAKMRARYQETKDNFEKIMSQASEKAAAANDSTQLAKLESAREQTEAILQADEHAMENLEATIGQ